MGFENGRATQALFCTVIALNRRIEIKHLLCGGKIVKSLDLPSTISLYENFMVFYDKLTCYPDLSNGKRQRSLELSEHMYNHNGPLVPIQVSH